MIEARRKYYQESDEYHMLAADMRKEDWKNSVESGHCLQERLQAPCIECTNIKRDDKYVLECKGGEKMNRVKLFKILLLAFLMVLSMVVLADVVPEMKFVKNTIERVEESEKTIARFSGSTIGISVAITALPDDFATPLADTLADMNGYFIFIYAVLFVEKLIVMEGLSIIFTYLLPIACILYILFVVTEKNGFKRFATKMVILSVAAVLVIPFSLFFAENIGERYLEYVDETIDEAETGAEQITEIMNTTEGEQSIFEKLSEAFKTAVQGVEDLVLYFKNVIKKFVNAISILLVTNFVIPLLTLLFFKWLLGEVFKLNSTIVVPQKNTGRRTCGRERRRFRDIINAIRTENVAEDGEIAETAEDGACEETIEDEEE